MLKRFYSLFQRILLLNSLIFLTLALIACNDIKQEQRQPTSLRIISLSPHLTENIYIAQLQDYLVGTVEYSDYPAAAKSITRIGNAFSVNKEKLLTLAPTHIIAWQDSLSTELKQFIEQHDITLLIDNADTFEDIAHNLDDLHQLHPNKHAIKNPALEFKEKYSVLQKSHQIQFETRAQKKRIRTAFLIWHSPLMAIGKPQIITQALELCGAKNIYGDINIASFTLSLEDLLSQKPHMIIRQTPNLIFPKALTDMSQRHNSKSESEYFKLVTLNNDILSRPSGNILNGVEHLCEHIHKASNAHTKSTLATS